MEQSRLIKFLVYWIAVSVVLNLSGSVFGGNVHLGNAVLQGSITAVLTGLILTGLYYQVPTIVKKLKFKVEKQNQWAIIFFAANTAAIWIIKTLAIITGLGIANILFVLLVGAFVTAGELAVDKFWKSLESK